jgi:hypothetical protein
MSGRCRRRDVRRAAQVAGRADVLAHRRGPRERPASRMTRGAGERRGVGHEADAVRARRSRRGGALCIVWHEADSGSRWTREQCGPAKTASTGLHCLGCIAGVVEHSWEHAAVSPLRASLAHAGVCGLRGWVTRLSCFARALAHARAPRMQGPAQRTLALTQDARGWGLGGAHGPCNVACAVALRPLCSVYMDLRADLHEARPRSMQV